MRRGVVDNGRRVSTFIEVSRVKIPNLLHLTRLGYRYLAELASAIGPLGEGVENLMLADTNVVTSKGTPEFERNKDPQIPMHRLLTSLFSRERLASVTQ